ncbi:MAG TPA: hypothetical protein PKC40_03570 [Saprospiraceae bacterium]|nr:hypothetical protein [Saprospiraceae bacterium]
MISAVFVLVFTFLLAQLVLARYRQELCHPTRVFNFLFFYHVLLTIVYYLYAKAEGSDAIAYYQKVETFYRSYTWLGHYGVGTFFIEFIGYPLVHFFGFSFEAVMLSFSFLGYLGFFFFYLAITKFIEFRHKLFGFDIILLLLFLPNIHFWSSSFGKGSVIFFGLGLFFYGLQSFSRNWLLMMLGAVIVFHVRAHILLVLLLGMLIAFFFSSKGIKGWQRALFIIVTIFVLSPVADTFLEYARIEETDSDTIQNFIQHRGSELGKADSSVEINNYNQLEKLFAFLFRPLFFDAPGALGLIVSFENLLYLFLFIKLFSIRFLRFLISSHWVIKFSLIAFLGISVALAQVSGNLGLAIRQKSQIMFLFFFVLLAYADWAYSQYGKKVIGE